MSRSKRRLKKLRNHKNRNEKRKFARNMHMPDKPVPESAVPSPPVESKNSVDEKPDQANRNGNANATHDGARSTWLSWDRLAELIIAVIVAYFAWVQSSTSVDQLGAMREELADSKEQGEVTANQLKAMEGQLTAMQRSVAVAEKSSDAAVAAVKATVDGNAIYQDAANRSLRAYVLVQNCSLMFNRNKQDLTADLELSNAGVTPAHKITITTCLFVEKPDFAGPWQLEHFTAEKEQEMSAGPGRVWAVNVILDLTQPELADIASGARVAWVMGRINYEDTFGIKRKTEFRYRQGEIVPVPIPVTGLTSYHMEFQNQGNGAD